jgi:hypothetical protein
MRGYTVKVCLGCFRDALVPCRDSRTPLCGRCLRAHSYPWGQAPPRLPDPDLPPAPLPPADRPGPAYVPSIPPLGRAKRRTARRTMNRKAVAA